MIEGELLDAHLVGAMTVLADHAPDTRVLDQRDGVAVTAVGAGGPSFNAATVQRPPTDPDGTVRWAAELLGGTGNAYLVHVPADLLPHVAGPLARCGLRQLDVVPGMARAAADAPEQTPGLRVVEVADERELEAFALAVGIGFGAPDPRASLDVLVPALLADDRVAMFAGYVDAAAEPAATSACVVAEGIAGIYAVTVHEPVRRRGIGAALTKAALAAGARRGAGVAALQATALGEPVYRRLGFATVREYHRFGPG